LKLIEQFPLGRVNNDLEGASAFMDKIIKANCSEAEPFAASSRSSAQRPAYDPKLPAFEKAILHFGSGHGSQHDCEPFVLEP
jgi:hypothetical protein